MAANLDGLVAAVHLWFTHTTAGSKPDSLQAGFAGSLVETGLQLKDKHKVGIIQDPKFRARGLPSAYAQASRSTGLLKALVTAPSMAVLHLHSVHQLGIGPGVGRPLNSQAQRGSQKKKFGNLRPEQVGRIDVFTHINTEATDYGAREKARAGRWGIASPVSG